MICTGVVECLSGGLAKNSKIMSMFVLFSRLFFGHSESLAFFLKRGHKPYTKEVKEDVFSQLFKGTTINNNIFKKAWLF